MQNLSSEREAGPEGDAGAPLPAAGEAQKLTVVRDSAEKTEPLDGGASARHAYDQLRDKILSGELPPGASFSQVQLATQLGISRTPVREAVRQLQTEGLLHSEPKRRVRVSSLSTDDLEDLYAMRVVLDSLAVRLTVPRLSDVELAEIRLAHEEMIAAAAQEEPDVAAHRAAHRRFHFGLYAHAGARLVNGVQDLWYHAERYRLLYEQHAGDLKEVARLSSIDHGAILEAAENHHAETAARRMAEHLARTALTTIVRTDYRHDPARVREALDHVYAENPTAAATPARPRSAAPPDRARAVTDQRSERHARHARQPR